MPWACNCVFVLDCYGCMFSFGSGVVVCLLYGSFEVCFGCGLFGLMVRWFLFWWV